LPGHREIPARIRATVTTAIHRAFIHKGDSDEESRLPRAYRVMLNWFLWLGALDHVIGLPISNWGGGSND
jgi:hypothetical protein